MTNVDMYRSYWLSVEMYVRLKTINHTNVHVYMMNSKIHAHTCTSNHHLSTRTHTRIHAIYVPEHTRTCTRTCIHAYRHTDTHRQIRMSYQSV